MEDNILEVLKQLILFFEQIDCEVYDDNSSSGRSCE